MTKTFRDNCDTNIVQQTSCEPLFPDAQKQLKMYFFVPFVHFCIRVYLPDPLLTSDTTLASNMRNTPE